MDTSPKNNVPWELITQSLSAILTDEEELRLQQWLSSDISNKAKYLQIKDAWEKGLDDYLHYKEADENKAWSALQTKMRRESRSAFEPPVIDGQFVQRETPFKKIMAIAAVFLGLVAVGMWLVMSVNTPVIYETLANAEKKVVLKDGSVINLKPLTRIIVAKGYDKDNRTVKMISGEAFFEVVHQNHNAFIVEIGKTQVKDIGTSFTIRKGNKEIVVAVSSGEVEFMKTDTKETRSLTAGTKVIFNVQEGRFGTVRWDKASGSFGNLLNFDNTRLLDAIISIQKVYDKKIVLADERIASKKITAHLNGMPFNTVVDVICKSLGLEYTIRDSIYILQERK